MRLGLPCLRLARIALQTKAPLSIGLGKSDGIFDNLLVRDANDLPAIPGSSLAGCLRHLFLEATDEETTNHLFGFTGQKGDGTTGKQPSEGGTSRLQVSWGAIHDSLDRPSDQVLMEEEARKVLDSDPLLRDAMEGVPLMRRRVCINHGGTAEDQAQFERVCLRKGHRFTVEIALWSATLEMPEWDQLFNLMKSPFFRLGGGTRSGLGSMKVVRIHQKALDLSRPEDFKQMSSLSMNMGDVKGWDRVGKPEGINTLSVQLKLRAQDLFRIGQGEASLRDDFENPQAVPDLLPLNESEVVWHQQGDQGDGERGSLSESRVVIPATGVKGALRHRVAFHYNALTGCFAGESPVVPPEENEAVRALFGHKVEPEQDPNGQTRPNTAGADQEKKPPKWIAGRVFFNDMVVKELKKPPVTVWHNVIDRFTGGVRQGFLFGEEAVSHDQELELNLHFTRLEDEVLKDKPLIKEALNRALKDMISGNLALGAGSSRGHGTFSGTMTWSDNSRWIEGGKRD